MTGMHFNPFIALLLDLQADVNNAGDKYMFLEHISRTYR